MYSTINISNTTQHSKSSTALNHLTTIQLVFYAVILVLGGLGNMMVIMIVKAKKSARKTNDYFILNLALGDILMLSVSIPVDFYTRLLSAPSGNLICKILWPFMTSSLMASIFTLTCMAVERSRVVCRPMAPKLQGRQLVYVILLIWFVAVFCVLPLVIVAVPDPRSGECHEAWPIMDMRKTYTAALTAIQYVIPLVIITIAYSMLSYSLKVSRQFRIDSIGTGEYSNDYRQNILEKRRNESSKINKNLLTIVILFAVFILPKQVAWLWLDFADGGSNKMFNDVLVFAEVMLYIHSTCNPLVYGTIMRDYRLAFKQYLKRLFCCHFHKYNLHLSLQRKISPKQEGVVQEGVVANNTAALVEAVNVVESRADFV